MSPILSLSAALLLLAPLVTGALDTLPSDGSYLQEEVGDAPLSPATNDRNPQGRLGFITVGGDATSSTSVTPLKIELGGVFLGTLIGLGFVLLAPKVSELFNHPSSQYHGAYSRSEDTGTVSGLTKVMSKIDETLQEYNIDSMACLERAACTYVQSAMSGKNTPNFLSSNSSHSLLNFVIDGSKLKTALDRGLSGENCSFFYPQCSFSKTTLVSGIRTLMAGNSL
ncbi:hypothetical protein GE061_001695 [Apolygus lucorum]|uniref:Uncharacterized protein n=1 Tax=Apolygus lucorum TaxID=248454 RepID=A0A6A4K2F5_APOLU|nr:hypothetical protein GE061_001695 [Apolygus lucorum]